MIVADAVVAGADSSDCAALAPTNAQVEKAQRALRAACDDLGRYLREHCGPVYAGAFRKAKSLEFEPCQA